MTDDFAQNGFGGPMNAHSTESTGRILVVDDDLRLCKLLKDFLEPLGYRVDTATSGPEGLRMAAAGDFDIVILDVMLPGMDGFEVLKALRRESDVPVLMLTARGAELDRVVGLETGADDYLPKTASTRELLARLRAITRRSMQGGRAARPSNDLPIVIADLRIDPAAHSASINGRTMDLTPHEFGLLLCLARAKGRVLSRNFLMEAIAGRDYDTFDRSVDVHISNLRNKMGDDPRNPRFIRTVRSAGYILKDLDEGGDQ